MSECVVRMEMPKSCYVCPCLDDYGDYPRCLISGEQRGYNFLIDEKRMSTCPILCQLPEGHGRLVDAELVKEILKPVDSISHHEPEWTWGELHESNCVAIDNAPTIVPAERSET